MGEVGSMSPPGGNQVVVKNILKFIGTVLKCENDFEISEFYPV